MEPVEVVEDIAVRILKTNPNPVVRFRLLRDVLRWPADGEIVCEAREDLMKSRWVKELKREQRKDGSWGRFHSQDTRQGQKIVTTEAGVTRGLTLGLTAGDPILGETAPYLVDLLKGAIQFPDPAERNNRWPAGVHLFVAGTLAALCPDLSELVPVRRLWAEIAWRTFVSGEYNPEAEWLAHCDLTGATDMRDSYLVIRNRYAVALLGSRVTVLPEGIGEVFGDWIWAHGKGIGYLDMPLSRLLSQVRNRVVERWLQSQELLSPFPVWRVLAKEVVEDLWSLRDATGLWDFGPGANAHNLHLSESWRKRHDRAYDHSTRVLALLRRYYG